MKNELTYEEAHRLFQYDTETGRLYWKISSARRVKAGDEAGGVMRDHRTQYRQVKVFGKNYLVHRVIWLMHYSAWPKHGIDHLDGEGLNNRIENLRDVPQRMNNRNRQMQINNTSGVNGVYWCKRDKKWRARSHDGSGKMKYLGYFANLAAAERAVREFQATLGYSERHGT